jgi:hypothetical protein
MLNIKKINIWQSEGFWVIDLIEEGQDSESLKICTKSLPDIYLSPMYKQAKLVKYPTLPIQNTSSEPEAKQE